MFAGKTTEMHRRLKRYEMSRKKCVAIKHDLDNRYTQSSLTCTHDRQTHEAIACRSLAEIVDKVTEAEVIAVDEGQFFEDIVEHVDRWANMGKVVIVSALDGTFKRDGFNNILDLVPKSELVTKLSAVCKMCGKDAYFTQRLGRDTRLHVVGGEELYIPVCRDCYGK